MQVLISEKKEPYIITYNDIFLLKNSQYIKYSDSLCAYRNIIIINVILKGFF